jgi:hypothetical protein
MGAEATRRRGLFGHRRDEVDAQASEVALRLEMAETRAQSAEARVGDLQSELMFYGDAIRSLKSDLETMTERVVSRVAPQMVELEARAADMEDMRQAVDETRAQVDAEREQLLAWRQEADQHLAELQEQIRRATAAIDETPERIRLALTPAADAMAGVSARMAVLAGASLPAQEVAESGPDALAAWQEFASPVQPDELDSEARYEGSFEEDSFDPPVERPVAVELPDHQPSEPENSLRSLAWE